MSTSIILLDQNFIADDADIMVFEPFLIYFTQQIFSFMNEMSFNVIIVIFISHLIFVSRSAKIIENNIRSIILSSIINFFIIIIFSIFKIEKSPK